MLVSAAASILATAALVSAHDHKSPGTPEYQKSLDNLRSASYLCAPQIATFNAERQRSWAQKVLGGFGGKSLEKELYVEGGWEDLASRVKTVDAGGKVLACSEVEKSKIRNHTCVLAPEVTEGPYYHVMGHPIRQNMAELEPGLLFIMNVGVIDVNTCEPLPDVLVDLWHANATGFYAGHPDPAPHLENEIPAQTGHRKGLMSAYPRTNDEETWLRAAQPTDKDGVTEFVSIFPGYYTGRATHVHTRIHPQYETMPNGTFVSKQMAHTGQFFVPDDLNVRIDKLWPYTTNHIKNIPGRGRVRNWADSLNIFEDSQEGGYQSTFDIKFLGGVLEQGLIGYITVVINSTAHFDTAWSVAQGKEKLRQFNEKAAGEKGEAEEEVARNLKAKIEL